MRYTSSPMKRYTQMHSWPDINTQGNGDDCGEMAFMCPVQMEKICLSMVDRFYKNERHRVSCSCLKEDWIDFCGKYLF